MNVDAAGLDTLIEDPVVVVLNHQWPHFLAAVKNSSQLCQLALELLNGPWVLVRSAQQGAVLQPRVTGSCT